MNVKRKLWQKVLSCFLALLIIIQVLPMSVFAEDAIQKQAIEATKPQAEDNDDNIVIETEIESMRTENSKTFLTANNEFYQVTSLKPIHNYNGKEWIDKIDCEDLSILSTDDVENYIDLQAESTQGTDNLVQSNEVTIDCTGEKIIENCEALIKTYSTENDISVRNVIDRFGTMIGEIYVKPYFPQDHSIFVTKATINMNIDKVGERYNLLAVSRLNADLESYNGSNVFASDPSKNYDLVEIYRGDDGKACSFDFTDYCHYTNLGFYENNGVAIIPAGTVDVSFDENITVSICYHEIDDLDSRYEYENVDLGRAGNVYINDYTCAPTLIRNELSLHSEIAPVTIQTIFNPMADICDSGLGEHTRLNYYSTLRYDNISNIYLWMNCEGENIVFSKKIYNNYYEGQSANGNEFRLYEFNSDKNNYSDTYIVNIEKDENQRIIEKSKYYFSSYNNTGYLNKILDASENQNQILINHSEVNNKYVISNIIDGNGRKYELTYENGYLKTLRVYNSNDEQISIDNKSLQINYLYENGLLKKVNYQDNKSIEYSYGNDNKLKSIKNIDNSIINFLYEIKFNNESYKLTSYNITDADNNTIEKVTISGIENSIYSRIFSNSNYSNDKELMFDKSFNLTSIQNYNGVKYYLDYTDGSLDYIINTDFSENTNLIRNGEFENCENTGLPTEWEYNLGYGSTAIQRELDLDDTVNRNNEKTLYLQNSNLLKCEVYQTINNYNNSSFSGGQSYIISGAAYRNEKPISSNDLRTFCIMVYDTAEDANGQLSPNNCLMKLDFDDTLKQKWQERKAIFTIKENTSALLVYLCYNNMTSTCDFDSIELYPVTTSNSIKADEIIPSTDVSYDYSENNSILEEIKTTVDGDELGALYNYTDDENYISKITNNGVPTYYNYDNDNGLLLSKGSNSDTSKNTQFAYSPVGLLESVNQAVTLIDSGSTVNINTNYTYENDRIKTVEHNNCIYEYEYDASGRVTSIIEYPTNTSTGNAEPENTSINKNNIVSYQYIDNEIGTISYGNGAKILYEYNQFGYLSKYFVSFKY